MKIINKVFSFIDIYTNNYILDNINLIKSIVIKNDSEAKLYNDYINFKYSSHTINLTDKFTWRYYKHLNAEYHDIDTPIYINSLDNNTNILLNKTNMQIHLKTHKELLKFGHFYYNIVSKYPEQELLIRSIITNTKFKNIQDIINASDFTIISYNDNLIEEYEKDIIYELQQYIDNYKVSKLIPYYQLADDLFLVSQYNIFYQYLFTKLLTIRLKNAKTLKAHSYHIYNYLASYHKLNKYINYLTKSQLYFLYRNLSYINNHVGRNNIFRILIDKLFTERNISLVNYRYNSLNTIDNNKLPNYHFNQYLLNNKNLPYSINNFTLEDIKDKEYKLAPGNLKEYNYSINKIDSKFKYSLYNNLLTKNLETSIIDNTDTVKYKLIPTLIDYLAYLIKNNLIDFIITINNPVVNKNITLNIKDSFKLFIYLLYKKNNIEITEFPEYTIKRVYKPILPSNDLLLQDNYRNFYFYNNLLNQIKIKIPLYNFISTSYSFYNFIFSIYNFNIGLWLLLCNFSHIDNEGQFTKIIDKLHTSDSLHFTDETVNHFLTRIGLESFTSYDGYILEPLIYNILNEIFDNRLDILNNYKYIQKALIEIFKKFNSYTVQLIDEYFVNNVLLTGQKDCRYSINNSKFAKLYFYDIYNLNVELFFISKKYYNIEFKEQLKLSSLITLYRHISLNESITLSLKNIRNIIIPITKNKILDFNITLTPVEPINNDTLLFLANH